MSLERLKKIYANTTQGRWLAWGWHGFDNKDRVCKQPEWYIEIARENELREAEQIFHGDDGANCDNPADAEFIAESHNKMGAIFKAIEALEWYADEANHQPKVIDTMGYIDPEMWNWDLGAIHEDGGERARQALSELNSIESKKL